MKKLLLLALCAVMTPTAWAASHREAPLTALDGAADITDFYAFVSYDDADKVTLIMNVDPLLEPGNGPNYFPFDPEITYRINVDNDHDAVADLTFEVKFETQIGLPDVFTGFVGIGADGARAPDGTPVVPPAITSLNSPGFSLKQTYEVALVTGTGRRVTRTVLASDLVAVPSNVGPRTMPDYPALASMGIYDIGDDVRVFAGTADDPFFIDLGAAFDTFNFRSTVGPGVLTDFQDESDDTNFAPDEVSGYNVNVIAIEVPITMLTVDGTLHAADEAEAVIGSWATTLRPEVKVLPRRAGGRVRVSPNSAQVQRMANPLINELIIGTGDKDLWSRSEPRNDANFADAALDPLLAKVLNALTNGVLAIPQAPRTDLLPLVQYLPPICPGCTTPEQQGPVADLLRLNTGIGPTPASERSRLGVLDGDLAGFPNGRRVSDDVTDIAARVVAGGVLAAPFPGFDPAVNGRLGDGVNTNDVPYQETFPYVAFAQNGRNSRHIDPGEPGCEGTCPIE